MLIRFLVLASEISYPPAEILNVPRLQRDLFYSVDNSSFRQEKIEYEMTCLEAKRVA